MLSDFFQFKELLGEKDGDIAKSPNREMFIHSSHQHPCPCVHGRGAAKLPGGHSTTHLGWGGRWVQGGHLRAAQGALRWVGTGERLPVSICCEAQWDRDVVQPGDRVLFACLRRAFTSVLREHGGFRGTGGGRAVALGAEDPAPRQAR